MYHLRYNTKLFVGGIGLIFVVFLLIADETGGGVGGKHGGLRL